ncbi:MAG: GNAT family N-acetyltransferase [Lachnospiraceae bacterium]|nr:GNAT family N-acetyltransferase [Lachnospiraceae bacterium]
MIRIFSVSNQPELKTAIMDYVVKSWKEIAEFFFEQLEQSMLPEEDIQDTFVMVDDDRIVGFYQFLRNEPIRNLESTPWISSIFIDEDYRGSRLSELFLIHGRIRAGKLGFREVFISTDQINLFEKFGFTEIGLDIDKWGFPTKIYVANALQM